MAKVFILQGGYAGKSIRLMNRYIFVDGVHLEESDENAKFKEANLCGFYGCKMMDHAEYLKSKAQPAPAAKPAASSPPQPTK
jgi:hypothetical protein